MNSEAQVKEMDIGVEPEEPSVVDFNQATAGELETLPGIGPALARRIVAYREKQGGFHSPEEISAVPGISRATYERLADRLTGTPPEIPLPPAVEEAPLEETPEAALASPEAPASQQMPSHEAEEARLEGLKGLEGERISPAEETPAAEEAPAPPRVEIAPPPSHPVPPREPFKKGGLSWLWSSLVGGLLGMFFTLLVFSGINGSLDLSNSHAVLDVQNRMDSVAAEMNSLQAEINGLRQRLDTLEGLTARMEKAESAVDTLRQETVALDQRTNILESELASVSESISVIQMQTQRVTTFFGQLQALLKETFGDEAVTGPTPEPPVETPVPTQ